MNDRGVVGIDRGRALEEGHRPDSVASFEQRRAEQMQGVGVLRRELEGTRRAMRAATLGDLVLLSPTLAPKVKLVEKRAAEKLAMTEV